MGTEGIPEFESVVSWGRLHHLRESLAVLAPVELARINNYAGDCGAVASDPFCCRVDYDGLLRARWGGRSNHQLQRCCQPESIRSEGGTVGSRTYNERNPMLMCHLSNGRKIRDVVLWVANALNVNSLRLLINCSREILRLVPIDELGVYAESGKEDFQLIVGSAIEVGRGDDVVSPRVRLRRWP